MKTKEQLIQEYLEKPFEVGTEVYVKGLGIQNKNSWGNITKILSIKDGGVYIKEYSSVNFVPFENIKKYTGHIGVNPFPDKRDLVRTSPRSLDSVLYAASNRFKSNGNYREKYQIDGITIQEVTDNPFVFLPDGTKKYYQRDYCWTLKQKQNLIDSIYNGVGCGLVIVRVRSWGDIERLIKQGHTDVAFHEIVDGKQRINAIEGFIFNEFKDSYGNYWEDLSDLAQSKFYNFMGFAYGELPERTTDEEVLYQFLKTNHAGVPQSKEHIEFVKSLHKNF